MPNGFASKPRGVKRAGRSRCPTLGRYTPTAVWRHSPKLRRCPPLSPIWLRLQADRLKNASPSTRIIPFRGLDRRIGALKSGSSAPAPEQRSNDEKRCDASPCFPLGTAVRCWSEAAACATSFQSGDPCEQRGRMSAYPRGQPRFALGPRLFLWRGRLDRSVTVPGPHHWDHVHIWETTETRSGSTARS